MRSITWFSIAAALFLIYPTRAWCQVAVGDRVEQPGYGTPIVGTVLEVGTGENAGSYLVKIDGNTAPQWVKTFGQRNVLFRLGAGGQRQDVNAPGQTQPAQPSAPPKQTTGTVAPPQHRIGAPALSVSPYAGTNANPHTPTRNAAVPTRPPTTSIGNAKAPNAVSARPGAIVGRAYTENGSAVNEFKVTASGHPVGYAPDAAAYTVGETFGRGGLYEIKLDGPHLITDIIAFAKVKYDGKEFNIPMYPADGLPSGPHAGHFRADGGKGVVRDFILKPSGLKPEYRGTPGVGEFRTDDLYQDAYYGGTVDINLSNPDASGRYGSDIGSTSVGSTITLQFAPAGPLIDGSAAQPITKTFKVQPGTYIYHFYNIPLGVYTVTASLNGAPLKLNDAAHDYKPSMRLSWEPSTGLTNSSARITTLHLMR